MLFIALVIPFNKTDIRSGNGISWPLGISSTVDNDMLSSLFTTLCIDLNTAQKWYIRGRYSITIYNFSCEHITNAIPKPSAHYFYRNYKLLPGLRAHVYSGSR